MAKHPYRPGDSSKPAKVIVDLTTMDEAERAEAVKRAAKNAKPPQPKKP